MTTPMNITVADHVYKDIVENARPKGMTRSEWVETLILKGYKTKKGGNDGEGVD